MIKERENFCHNHSLHSEINNNTSFEEAKHTRIIKPTLFIIPKSFVLQSFFGRTYNNLSSVSECKNNGECIINKKNRTSCKACRLRKCLLVGMSKSGSRYGRRSNWFKIHCLLQEQQLQQQQQHQQHLQHQTQLTAAIAAVKKPWDYAKLDIDNNNAPPPSDSRSPESPPYPHGLSKTPDSPSFWSSRAFSVPATQHSLPYFISPFLQSPLQPVGQNYLLPFLPIRAPLPLEPLVIPSPPSSLHTSPTSTVTPKKEPAADSRDSPVQQFRPLGPEQDQPIDLSATTTTTKEVEVSRHKLNLSPDLSGQKNAIVPEEKVEQERTETLGKGATVPLDLRCSKS